MAGNEGNVIMAAYGQMWSYVCCNVPLGLSLYTFTHTSVLRNEVLFSHI